ncbi:helix-turn-helix transcriptional regulator [Rhodoferax sp.]|uniref:helix-turn-helix transcriptional regulator n=1 Tax=Rhodoferax sp. TaxID=50421 RepID=UPI00274C3D61|nr:helix-turn-helix transcriptional regulator [Rhodoferax sp.]
MPLTEPNRRTFNHAALVAAMQSLDSVDTGADFVTWTKTDFHRALAHGAFMGCVGKVLAQGVQPMTVVSANFPDECMGSSAQPHARCSTFLMQSWLQSGQPQLFDLRCDAHAPALGCLKAFKASGLHNIVAHGLFDINREHVSFFSFHQLTHPPRAEQAMLLRLIVPGMHAALLRCLRSQGEAPRHLAPQAPALTSRETQVLSWICHGKSNSEIASILQVSPHTVKNQAQAVMIKLKVNTRAQAAAQAMRHQLVH